MATITVKGFPAKKNLWVRLRKNSRKNMKKYFFLLIILPFPFVCLCTLLSHVSYIKRYNQKMLTLRHDLTMIDIPKHLRAFYGKKIFCSFPKDLIEEITYDTQYLNVFIQDIIIGPEFTTREQKKLMDEVSKICKKHFPNLKVSVRIKGISSSQLHLEL